METGVHFPQLWIARWHFCSTALEDLSFTFRRQVGLLQAIIEKCLSAFYVTSDERALLKRWHLAGDVPRNLSTVTLPIKKFPSSSVDVKIQGFQVCPWLLSSHVYEDSKATGRIVGGRFSPHRDSVASYPLPKENVWDAWHRKMPLCLKLQWR